MKKLLLLILLIAPAASAADNAANYYAPPSQTGAAMEIMDMGFANIFALFRIGTGGFTFDDATKSLGNLRIAIDTTSLLAASDANQRDLSNMLGTFQNPEIRITAPDNVTFNDSKADIKATLTLHGASKPITLQATLNRSGKSPHGGGMWGSEGDAVGLSLLGNFKRSDFGLSDSPDIAARFGDVITLRLEMQALRQ